MVAHGLLTPGVMDRPFSVWISRMPDLAIFGFAVGLGLASLPRRIWTSRLAVNHRLAVLIVPNVVVLALSTVVVADPLRWHGAAPVELEEFVTWVVSAVDLVLFGAVAFVHWRRWRLGRDVVQYALGAGRRRWRALRSSRSASASCGASRGGTTTASSSPASAAPSTRCGSASGAPSTPSTRCSRPRSTTTR